MSYSLRIPKLDIPDDVFISVEDIGESSDLPGLEAESLLSSEERKKAEAFYFEMNRRQYIRGRAFLRKKLSELLSLAPDKIVLATGEHGKPFLPNSDLVFNLSHSGSLALYAFSRKQEALGVDIEERSRSVKIHELGRHCFTEKEIELLNEAPLANQNDLFFRIWRFAAPQKTPDSLIDRAQVISSV